MLGPKDSNKSAPPLDKKPLEEKSTDETQPPKSKQY
ncbi:hypothetical protein SAMN06295910_1448 [Allosphingosinicella indica]|uniref:Uncharacterized protein n=1 Tax=Allosphingosinicella indica TaxID=941907 RepID=A0A1X7GB60_9SPHN|nr:hypothetical protein SAMN06295910_1448 [Allosphingosinicella indica]